MTSEQEDEVLERGDDQAPQGAGALEQPGGAFGASLIKNLRMTN